MFDVRIFRSRGLLARKFKVAWVEEYDNEVSGDLGKERKARSLGAKRVIFRELCWLNFKIFIFLVVILSVSDGT